MSVDERQRLLRFVNWCFFNFIYTTDEAVGSASCKNNEAVFPSSTAQVWWVHGRGSDVLLFVAERCHLTLSFSFADLPYHSNQICDTNWDIVTMTTRVKCCVQQILTGSPTFPPSPRPPPPLFSSFAPLCQGPEPAKRISKWHLTAYRIKETLSCGFSSPNVASLPEHQCGEEWEKVGPERDNGGLPGERQGRGQESECGGH